MWRVAEGDEEAAAASSARGADAIVGTRGGEQLFSIDELTGIKHTIERIARAR